MSLWDLLTVICAAMTVGGAISAAKVAGMGSKGYVLATAIGILVGIASAWVMRRVGDLLDARTRPYSEAQRERYLSALYLAVVLWAFLSIFLGLWSTSLMLTVVR